MAKRKVVNPSPAQNVLSAMHVSRPPIRSTTLRWTSCRLAGCERIFQEHGSGAPRARPVLTRLLGDLAAGDVLVVVRLDRLARSVSHLLQVIEDLEERSVHFRSIRDPIDTSTPQGMFSLQVLGAVAPLERALIAERTKAGSKAAKARDKLPGLPHCSGIASLPRHLPYQSLRRSRRCLSQLCKQGVLMRPVADRFEPTYRV